MNYWLNLFSPQTYSAFSETDKTISGFRESQLKAAKKVQVGDVFVCYMTRLSRWVGLLKVVEGPFRDETPLFLPEEDPFVIRFKVEPLVWLDPKYALPIHDDAVWSGLSFTQGHETSTSRWTSTIRSSLRDLGDDGAFLAGLLEQQQHAMDVYELSDKDLRKLSTHFIQMPEGTVTVTVPEDEEELEVVVPDVRESYRIQALLAEIGAQMGYKIWLPVADRSSVTKVWEPEPGELVHVLPLNYDETTLKTIERIDVLWLRRRSIVRAFEVEHTTAIYSGILRMADLLALQPNMDIRVHIVAPGERRERVFEQLTRPVFTLLERGPLSKLCTFIPYDAVYEIHQLKHLSHFTDSVVDEYGESADHS